MESLATVTTLRHREETPDAAPIRADESSTIAYWARVQALRAELAELRGAG